MRESTIKDILTGYERKRDLAEKELEARKKRVYHRIPEIKEIDDEVAKIGLKLAKLVLKRNQLRKLNFPLRRLPVQKATR